MCETHLDCAFARCHSLPEMIRNLTAALPLVLACHACSLGNQNFDNGEDELGNNRPKAAVQDGGEQPSVPLCDGSDDVRFITTTSGGGFVEPFWSYSKYHGYAFVAIDGHCRFWTNGSGIGPTSTGEVADQDARRFAQDSHFGRFASVSDFMDSQCRDAPTVTLIDPTARLDSFCTGTDDNAPQAWQDAFTARTTLVERLQTGSPSWGPAEVFPIRVAEVGDNPVIPWTVDVDLDAAAIDSFEERDENWGVLVSEPTSVEQLSAVRQAAIDLGSTTVAFVRDDDGGIFSIYVRDKLPAEIEVAVNDAIGHGN